MKKETVVYKSQKGRDAVEAWYRGILKDFSHLNFEQIFITSGSRRTHVLKFGNDSKPALIMLHGSMSNSASWLGIIEMFTGKFCVYCIDIPGEPGLSDPYRLTLSSEAPAEWLTGLLEALHIEKTSFLTISLGSWYAIDFASRFPGRVQAFSILTTPGIAPARTDFIFKALFYLMLGSYGKKLLNRAIFHKTDIPEEMIEFQNLVMGSIRPMTEPIPIFRDSVLRSIRCRVQYFGGDHDVVLDTGKTAQRLKENIPDAEIHVLKDTGHAIIDRFGEISVFLEQSNG